MPPGLQLAGGGFTASAWGDEAVTRAGEAAMGEPEMPAAAPKAGTGKVRAGIAATRPSGAAVAICRARIWDGAGIGLVSSPSAFSGLSKDCASINSGEKSKLTPRTVPSLLKEFLRFLGVPFLLAKALAFCS